MSRSRCISGGLINRPGQCNLETSRTPSDEPIDITPEFCCTAYFFTTGSSSLLLFLFFLAADWTIGFVARSPVTGCEVSIHTLNSRLLRGSEVISKSSSSPSSGYFVTGNKTDVVFEKVVMPKVIGDVTWNARVEIMFAMNTDVRYLNGFLMAACPRIPVKFTTDQAGKVTGSLLGNVKRCDYIFQKLLA
ncbi:unnamed protein product [Arabidopsis thaliana]|uniref:(thale cress) hypothetical protein n=1 Tax=Arabidopsis thaliana TaxID=3702 RepID=A0A7G2FG95_ARATH|nr:unnamed protein product [Arabidopsis thaliana]